MKPGFPPISNKQSEKSVIVGQTPGVPSRTRENCRLSHVRGTFREGITQLIRCCLPVIILPGHVPKRVLVGGRVNISGRGDRET